MRGPSIADNSYKFIALLYYLDPITLYRSVPLQQFARFELSVSTNSLSAAFGVYLLLQKWTNGSRNSIDIVRLREIRALFREHAFISRKS